MTPRRQTISGARPRPLDILVVEDCEGTQLMLELSFDGHGCVARMARTVAEADAAIRETVPDVVVCGLEHDEPSVVRAFAERLRDDPRTSHVGRIALTDRGDATRDAQAAFEVDLQKRPLHVGTLFALVEELAITGRLRRRSQRR